MYGNPSTLNDLHKLHALCQVHNSFIQNKIGSGFDISCAIFGSQFFQRNYLIKNETIDFLLA